MKRVLVFSLAYLPKHIGGAEIAIKEITNRVPRTDIEFHMITNRYDASLPRVEQVGNVLVHRIGLVRRNPTMADLRRFPLHLNKALYQFLAFIHAVRLHRKYHYDGIWAMMAHATGVPAALFTLFFPRVPYLLTLQEGDPPEYIERTMRPLWPLFTRAFTRADIVQAISGFLASWAKRRNAKRTVIVPNGVDLSRFKAAAPEGLRATFVGEGEVLVVTASRLVRKNGVDTVIDALAHLSAHVHFLVLGDGPERTALEARVERAGASSRVHFFGEATQAELPALLAASDVFVRASRSEGQGIAFLEAMAAGLPTVGTAVGGIVDFLKDGETGFLAPPEDPQALAHAIMRAIADREAGGPIAKCGQSFVRASYDWDRIVALMRERCFSIFG